MSEYKFTYFLNTACAERRPQTRRDLIEDWKEEEREYPTALEAFEHAYIEILDNDEEDLQDLYEENGIGPNDEVKKLEALKNDFDCIDPGDGSTILISIEGEGPVDSYDSGFTKESFNDDYMEDDDYDDDDYLDENKKLNEVDSKNKSVILIKNNEHPCRYWHKGAPCFKYGKYEWYPEVINNSINRNELEDYRAFETTQDDFSISEITPKITIDEFNKLITPEMEQEYVKLLNQFEHNRDFKGTSNKESSIETYIDIDENGEEAPYLYGYANIDVEDYDIEDRYDLSEDELFITGWSGIVQNLKDAPFKLFKDMEISCFDGEKGEEYNLPDIPENIQKEFVKKVNKWIEENPDELDESKKLKEDEQLEIDEQGLPVLGHPYSLRKRNDGRFQITSSHPYDMTDYSYAISKTNDIKGDWEVYDPENPRTIVSDYSARKTTLEGTYKGWNEVLDAMKRIDSNKKRRIDRT